MNQEKRRVLMVNDISPSLPAGAPVAASRLAHGLVGRGHTVAMVVPSTTLRDTRSDNNPGSGITVYGISSISMEIIYPRVRLVSGIALKSKLASIIEEFRPDVIHIQMHLAMGSRAVSLARHRSIPVVGTNHFMPENAFAVFKILTLLQRPLRPIIWAHCIHTYNRLDYVIAPSRTCLQMMQKRGLTAPARVISNGLNLTDYRQNALDDTVYDRYRIRRGIPLFLTVGRLVQEKGIALMLRATALARSRSQTEFQLVVVGVGKHGRLFKRLATRLGLGNSVVFTGYVPDRDLETLYQVAHIYIGAGVAELQGISVMEAMASGVPVLAADCGALPELVDDGVSGFLFKPTPQDLAQQMQRILHQRNEWSRMGRAGRHILQSHDMSLVLPQIEELYSEVLSSH